MRGTAAQNCKRSRWPDSWPIADCLLLSGKIKVWSGQWKTHSNSYSFRLCRRLLLSSVVAVMVKVSPFRRLAHTTASAASTWLSLVGAAGGHLAERQGSLSSVRCARIEKQHRTGSHTSRSTSSLLCRRGATCSQFPGASVQKMLADLAVAEPMCFAKQETGGGRGSVFALVRQAG